MEDRDRCSVSDDYDEPAASILKVKEEVECGKNGVDVAAEQPPPTRRQQLTSYIALHGERCEILKSLASRMTTDVLTCSHVAAWAVNKVARPSAAQTDGPTTNSKQKSTWKTK